MIRLPTLARRRVTHLGTLDPRLRGQGAGGATSLEGHHLSVSTCPQAWREIACLGGVTALTLHRERGRFLDVHRARRQPELMRAAVKLDLARDWCVPGQVWRVQEGERYFESLTLQDACSELLLDSWADATAQVLDRHAARAENLEVYRDLRLAGVPILRVEQPRGTALLADLTGLCDAMLLDAAQGLLTAWAEEHGLDGLWWTDRLDVNHYSAPRGLIFNSRLAAWKVAA